MSEVRSLVGESLVAWPHGGTLAVDISALWHLLPLIFLLLLFFYFLNSRKDVSTKDEGNKHFASRKLQFGKRSSDEGKLKPTNKQNSWESKNLMRNTDCWWIISHVLWLVLGSYVLEHWNFSLFFSIHLLSLWLAGLRCFSWPAIYSMEISSEENWLQWK